MTESRKNAPLFFLIAGEASADLHGAALLRELKKELPDLQCFGVGGKALAAEGMEISVDARKINVVGYADWIDRIAEVVSSYRKLGRLIRERRPDCAILLDLPDLNLRMAKKLKAAGVPVVYYISPQVWAWRKYRIHAIKKLVDRMLVLFPFEKKFYEGHGVDAKFVGHPLLETITPRSSYRTQDEIRSGPRIAILPGSRKSEIRYHLPLVRGLVPLLKQAYPTARLQIPVASTLSFVAMKEAFAGRDVDLVEGSSHQVIRDCDFALVASGTATLETALIGTPFCLFYRANYSTVWVYRNIVRYTGYIGMPNLLLGREVAKEIFQEQATPENLFRECQRLVEEQDYREEIGASLRSVRDCLGTSGASERAAFEVVRLLRGEKPKGPLLARNPAYQ